MRRAGHLEFGLDRPRDRHRRRGRGRGRGPVGRGRGGPRLGQVLEQPAPVRRAASGLPTRGDSGRDPPRALRGLVRAPARDPRGRAGARRPAASPAELDALASRLSAPGYYAPRFTDAERAVIAEETAEARGCSGMPERRPRPAAPARPRPRLTVARLGERLVERRLEPEERPLPGPALLDEPPARRPEPRPPARVGEQVQHRPGEGLRLPARRRSRPGSAPMPSFASGVATTALPMASASSSLFCSPAAARIGATQTSALAIQSAGSSTVPVTVTPSRPCRAWTFGSGSRPTR
jgi:hypothetical protein